MGTKGYNNQPQRIEPSYDNVVFIDEYPELAKRVWLRRLAEERAGKVAMHLTEIIAFPENPDGAA